MSTINSREIVDQIISWDGYYPGDPRVIKIVQYENYEGNHAYGMIYKGGNLNQYHESEYVRNPTTLWEAK